MSNIFSLAIKGDKGAIEKYLRENGINHIYSLFKDHMRPIDILAHHGHLETLLYILETYYIKKQPPHNPDQNLLFWICQAPLEIRETILNTFLNEEYKEYLDLLYKQSKITKEHILAALGKNIDDDTEDNYGLSPNGYFWLSGIEYKQNRLEILKNKALPIINNGPFVGADFTWILATAKKHATLLFLFELDYKISLLTTPTNILFSLAHVLIKEGNEGIFLFEKCFNKFYASSNNNFTVPDADALINSLTSSGKLNLITLIAKQNPEFLLLNNDSTILPGANNLFLLARKCCNSINAETDKNLMILAVLNADKNFKLNSKINIESFMSKIPDSNTDALLADLITDIYGLHGITLAWLLGYLKAWNTLEYMVDQWTKLNIEELIDLEVYPEIDSKLFSKYHQEKITLRRILFDNRPDILLKIADHNYSIFTSSINAFKKNKLDDINNNNNQPALKELDPNKQLFRTAEMLAFPYSELGIELYDYSSAYKAIQAGADVFKINEQCHYHFVEALAKKGHVEALFGVLEEFYINKPNKEKTNALINILFWACNAPMLLRKQILEKMLTQPFLKLLNQQSGITEAHIKGALGQSTFQTTSFDNFNLSPLDYFALSGIEFLLYNPDNINLLNQCKTNRKIQKGPFKGATLPWLLAFTEKFNILNQFILLDSKNSKGCISQWDLNAKIDNPSYTTYGMTLLYLLTIRKQREIVSYLIKNTNSVVDLSAAPSHASNKITEESLSRLAISPYNDTITKSLAGLLISNDGLTNETIYKDLFRELIKRLFAANKKSKLTMPDLPILLGEARSEELIKFIVKSNPDAFDLNQNLIISDFTTLFLFVNLYGDKFILELVQNCPAQKINLNISPNMSDVESRTLANAFILQMQQIKNGTLAWLLAAKKYWRTLEYLVKQHYNHFADEQILLDIGPANQQTLRKILEEQPSQKIFKNIEKNNAMIAKKTHSKVKVKTTANSTPHTNANIQSPSIHIELPTTASNNTVNDTQISKKDQVKNSFHKILEDKFVIEIQETKKILKLTFTGNTEDINTFSNRVTHFLKQHGITKNGPISKPNKQASYTITGTETAVKSLLDNTKFKNTLKDNDKNQHIESLSLPSKKQEPIPLSNQQQENWGKFIRAAFCHAKQINITWISDECCFEIRIENQIIWQLRHSTDRKDHFDDYELPQDFIDSMISHLIHYCSNKNIGLCKLDDQKKLIKLYPTSEIETNTRDELHKQNYSKLNPEWKRTEQNNNNIDNIESNLNQQNQIDNTPEILNQNILVNTNMSSVFNLEEEKLILTKKLFESITTESFNFLTKIKLTTDGADTIKKWTITYNLKSTLGSIYSIKYLEILQNVINEFAKSNSIDKNNNNQQKLFMRVFVNGQIVHITIDPRVTEFEKFDDKLEFLQEKFQQQICSHISEDKNIHDIEATEKLLSKTEEITHENNKNKIFVTPRYSTLFANSEKKFFVHETIANFLKRLLLLAELLTGTKQEAVRHIYYYAYALNAFGLFRVLGWNHPITDKDNIFYKWRHVIRHTANELNWDEFYNLVQPVVNKLCSFKEIEIHLPINFRGKSENNNHLTDLISYLKNGLEPFENQIEQKTLGKNKNERLNKINELTRYEKDLRNIGEYEICNEVRRDAVFMLHMLIGDIHASQNKESASRSVANEIAHFEFDDNYDQFLKNLNLKYLKDQRLPPFDIKPEKGINMNIQKFH